MWIRVGFNGILKSKGYELQKQAYDRVLRDSDRDRFAFEKLIAYVLLNPERAALIGESSAPRRLEVEGLRLARVSRGELAAVRPGGILGSVLEILLSIAPSEQMTKPSRKRCAASATDGFEGDGNVAERANVPAV